MRYRPIVTTLRVQESPPGIQSMPYRLRGLLGKGLLSDDTSFSANFVILFAVLWLDGEALFLGRECMHRTTLKCNYAKYQFHIAVTFRGARTEATLQYCTVTWSKALFRNAQAKWSVIAGWTGPLIFIRQLAERYRGIDQAKLLRLRADGDMRSKMGQTGGINTAYSVYCTHFSTTLVRLRQFSRERPAVSRGSAAHTFSLVSNQDV